MSPEVLENAVLEAKKFIALATALDDLYPTYHDSRGQKHYVPGPGTRQIRDAIEELKYSLQIVRWNTACALPAIDIQ